MKKKIRVAVCVDSNGEYGSCGWDQGNNLKSDYDYMLTLAEEHLDFPTICKTFWLEAEVELPNEYAIEGEVKEVDTDESEE